MTIIIGVVIIILLVISLIKLSSNEITHPITLILILK